MLDSLKQKKIAILGFGKEGQATFEYLKKHGVSVAAVLDKNAEQFNNAQTDLSGVTCIGGEAYLDSINEFDLLFRAPGIPRNHPKLLAYKNQDAVYSHTKLFFEICPCDVVGVTGTKGKTTTASLIYEILKRSGKSVFLGGNIGVPPLSFVDHLNSDSVAVLELSSFQTIDLHKSPHTGVILTVTSDHLDDGSFRPSSHSTTAEYLGAKAQMIAHQDENDFAILHPSLGEVFLNSGRGRKIFFDAKSYEGYLTNLLGSHNFENIAAAAETCKALGVAEDVIRIAVAEFAGVPQRLQFVGEKNGIKYVNDSASTNPDSTLAAIESFDSGLVLIIGGYDKGIDYKNLCARILSANHIKGLVVVGDLSAKLLPLLQGFKGKILTGSQNMQEIIDQANSLAETGDVILLSPAAASFGMFKDSKDRGSQFDQTIKSL